MTEPKFTPAPWEVGLYGTGAVFSGDGLEMVASVYPCENDEQNKIRREANEYLIAAAPDLYEALVEMIESWSRTIGAETDETIKARKTLAKARGEL